MGRESREIVAAVDALASVERVDDLARLQELVDRYFALPDAADHLDVWFRLYERFPAADGYGIFWSLLHGIESQPGFERFAVASIRRRPTPFPIQMVNGLLNAGVESVDGADLLALVRQSAATDLATHQQEAAEPDVAPDRPH